MTARVVRTAQEILWWSMNEKAWTASVVKTAVEFGWERYHPWTSIHSPAGFPDEVLVRPPRLVFAELKSMAGTVSAKQQKWIGLLAQIPGVEMYVWRPCDQEQVDRVLAPDNWRWH